MIEPHEVDSLRSTGAAVDDVQTLLTQPDESRDVEYKQWLDLNSTEHTAVLAKALIALANYGGGRVVLGFKSKDHGTLEPCDDECPGSVEITYARERLQQIIARYASHRFEITCDFIARGTSGVAHPVISVPADVRTVIYPTHGSPDGNTLVKGRLYTRLAGPRSATPETASEWDEFVDGLMKRRATDFASLFSAMQQASPVGDASVAAPPTSQRTVRDRMSDAPAPNPTSSAKPASLDQLEPEERFVLEHPISDHRVAALKEKVRQHLEESMPSFRLFAAAGVRRRELLYDPLQRFGMGLTSFKGPFVEESSWIEVRERQFALAIDRYLLKQFAELLVERHADPAVLGRSPATIQEFVRTARASLVGQGASVDLVVIVEPPNGAIDDLFMLDHTWWDGPRVVRGQDQRGVTFVHGSIDGLPVLQIHENLADRPLLCVVDLADFELLLGNVTPELDDYIDLRITPIDATEAEQWVRKNPKIRESMYEGKHHAPGSYSIEEAALRMQLMAKYELLASGEVRERHRPRTISTWVEPGAG